MTIKADHVPVQITMTAAQRAQLRAVAALKNVGISQLVSEWIDKAAADMGLPDSDEAAKAINRG